MNDLQEKLTISSLTQNTHKLYIWHSTWNKSLHVPYEAHTDWKFAYISLDTFSRLSKFFYFRKQQKHTKMDHYIN